MKRALRLAAMAAVAWVGLGATGNVLAQAPAQRSAQSDCEREASRRGYTVLATRNYQQYKDGWSLDLQARDTAGRVSWGSCFVETRTGDVSLYGFGWGAAGGGSGGSASDFSCASVEGKYRECQLPVNGRARLVKQKSDAPCIEGRSWGQRGDRVWVDDGCRARFEVSFGGGSGGSGARYVDCRSEQQRYRECPIQRGHVGRLVSDDSAGKCRSPGAWGTRDGLIWVNYGCKGRFEVVRPGGGSGGAPGSGNAGQQQRAEVQCRNQAVRDGVSVRYVAPPQLHGSYWETTVQGTRSGRGIRAICRFYPNSSRAELYYGG
jgi:hypothetical protein